MTYLEGFSNLLNNNLFLTGKTLHGEQSCGDVNIKGNCIILKLDTTDFKDRVINTIFVPGKARCVSDFIILSDSIFLACEMKSNNEGNMKIQLKNTGKIINYLISMVHAHFNITVQLPQLKFVCFSNSNVSKQTTRGYKLTPIVWADGQSLFRLPCNTSYHLHQFI